MVHVLSDQKKDGSFDHYVTFGLKSPLDADDKDVVKCATEKDAYKLKKLVEANYVEANGT